MPKRNWWHIAINTTQKMKFSIKDFFRKLRIRSHLLKKSLVEKLLFCAVKRTNKSLTFQIEKGIFHTTFRQHVVTSIVFLMLKAAVQRCSEEKVF